MLRDSTRLYSTRLNSTPLSARSSIIDHRSPTIVSKHVYGNTKLSRSKKTSRSSSGGRPASTSRGPPAKFRSTSDTRRPWPRSYRGPWCTSGPTPTASGATAATASAHDPPGPPTPPAAPAEPPRRRPLGQGWGGLTGPGHRFGGDWFRNRRLRTPLPRSNEGEGRLRKTEAGLGVGVDRWGGRQTLG